MNTTINFKCETPISGYYKFKGGGRIAFVGGQHGRTCGQWHWNRCDDQRYNGQCEECHQVQLQCTIPSQHPRHVPLDETWNLRYGSLQPRICIGIWGTPKIKERISFGSERSLKALYVIIDMMVIIDGYWNTVSHRMRLGVWRSMFCQESSLNSSYKGAKGNNLKNSIYWSNTETLFVVGTYFGEHASRFTNQTHLML